ncbi:TPA: TPM domain-containing protein [Candidatus Woesearchaeota archaeon]|nr:MAG: hypothetical protein QT04_C0051G0009 [archaeon GW2011_AR11]HIH91665.1 TPM domain-containing protein [Candidatus Woesearchaeota archaeon]HII64714.1 TPM domain-containing protein [Candidatus Woesearchaeota archaeon]
MRKAVLCCVFLCLFAAAASAQIPTLGSYATDKAGVLSPEFRDALEDALRALEQETNGVQFVVYIENEYPKGYSLEEYTLKIAEENEVGKKGNDNGLLLYIAVDDRAYRWETGYGIEATLSAPLLGRISREYLAAAFREGNYERGILDTVNVTARILLHSQDADIVKLLEEESSAGNGRVIAIVAIIVIALVVIGAIIAVSEASKKGARKNSWREDVYMGAATGMFGPRWGGGGFGGGGFGGFSGGGGHFGGGGFSGKW